MTAPPLPLPLAGVRPLELADAAPLQGLLTRCAGYFRAADGRGPGPHAAMERLAEAAGDDAAMLWGAWRQDQLVGLLEVRLHEPGPREITVVLLLVDPAARRAGLGRSLIDALVEPLDPERWRALCLGVQDPQKIAHAFWLALGFVPHGREAGVTRYVRALG